MQAFISLPNDGFINHLTNAVLAVRFANSLITTLLPGRDQLVIGNGHRCWLLVGKLGFW